MDNFDAQQLEPASPVLLNNEAIKALSETRKWTNFFSILGIIVIVIILFAAVIMAFVLPSLNEEAGQDVSPVFIGLLYLIFSALYLLPVIYLFRFGSMMKKAIAESSNQLMGAAFKNLSLHFRTIGIISIVFISFYILAILLMLIFGMGMFAGDLFKAWKILKRNAFLRFLLLAGLILESIYIFIYGKLHGPVHFSINGLPDGYGNQKFLALLPFAGFLLFLLLNWLRGMKHILNYPVKITPLNRAKQETLIGGLIDDYSMITLLSFNLLSAYLIYTLTAEQSKEIWVVMLFLIIGYAVPLFAYMKKANSYK